MKGKIPKNFTRLLIFLSVSLIIVNCSKNRSNGNLEEMGALGLLGLSKSSTSDSTDESTTSTISETTPTEQVYYKLNGTLKTDGWFGSGDISVFNNGNLLFTVKYEDYTASDLNFTVNNIIPNNMAVISTDASKVVDSTGTFDYLQCDVNRYDNGDAENFNVKAPITQDNLTVYISCAFTND